MKKISMILLTIVMVFFCSLPVAAENMERITYIIYNENGAVIEEGTVPQRNTRGNWSGITLASGQSISFNDSGHAFIKYSGQSMTFKYTLSSSAKMVTRIMKTSSYSGTGTAWSTTIKTASSGTVTKTADETAYYYPQLTNSSTSYITITSASFN